MMRNNEAISGSGTKKKKKNPWPVLHGAIRQASSHTDDKRIRTNFTDWFKTVIFTGGE